MTFQRTHHITAPASTPPAVPTRRPSQRELVAWSLLMCPRDRG